MRLPVKADDAEIVATITAICNEFEASPGECHKVDHNTLQRSSTARHFAKVAGSLNLRMF